jgi:hypothetical protein
LGVKGDFSGVPTDKSKSVEWQIGVDAQLALSYAAPMKKTAKPEKLTKADPEFYSKIAALAGRKLLKKRGTDYFSKLAAKSHPRAEYHGGRPKKAA